MLIKEACLENYTLLSRAISCGANRIELCDNLSCGGTTVSKGVMAESLKYTHEEKVPVTVLIRPRGGWDNPHTYIFFYRKILDSILSCIQVDSQTFGSYCYTNA